MSEADRLHWDARHAEHGSPDADGTSAASVFAPFERLFPTRGSALEIACGRGQGSVWLASRGMTVCGVDVSPVAIASARERAARAGFPDRCRFEVWDLDRGLPESPPVDLLLCHLFRDARLDRAIVERLAPGGLAALAVLSEVGAAPGRFRARPGELRRAFAPLEILEEGERDGVAWLIGRRR